MCTDHSLSTTTPTTGGAADNGGGTVFAALPRDIINTHILARLDALTLASVGCVSTWLYSLSINEDLWRKICHDTWPSVKDPRVHHAIVSLPLGYQSLFSDSYSSLRCRKIKSDGDCDCELSAIPDELISAIDMHYKERSVYSKVQVTNTLIAGFLDGPTWVNMTNLKENVANETEFGAAEDGLVSHVAENVTLSWIMIDPTRKLAANLSSLQPVLVEPHFLKGHVRIRYSTILSTGNSFSDTAEIRIDVTCMINEEEEVQVKEMKMVVLDMYGENLKWKDSLVILEKSRMREDMKGGEIYEEYLKRIRERRREKEMAQVKGFKIEGIICLLLFSVVLLSWAIWYFFKRYILRRKER